MKKTTDRKVAKKDKMPREEKEWHLERGADPVYWVDSLGWSLLKNNLILEGFVNEYKYQVHNKKQLPLSMRRTMTIRMPIDVAESIVAWLPDMLKKHKKVTQ